MTEQFTPSIFISRFRHLTKGSEGMAIGVHFNVSAYAPIALFDQFLQGLVLWGLIYDPFTGDMEQVDPAFKWHIFIELNCAPAEDTQFANQSSMDNSLKSLPILCHAAQRQTENEHLPLELNDDVAIVCNFFTAYQGTTRYNSYIKSISFFNF